MLKNYGSKHRLASQAQPDRADRQLTLVDAEGGLGFGELDIGPPQRLGRPVGDVGAQHVAVFAVGRPFVPFGPRRPFQPQTGGDSGVCDEADRVTSGGARVAPEKAADLALGGAAILRVLSASLKRL